MKKRLWTVEEDIRLLRYIKLQGDRRWRALAKAAGLQRCGRSCRLRWVNHLHPNLKHDNISIKEENLIIDLHGHLGSRWSQIAEMIPGRTDNNIKNYWRTHLKRKLQNSTQNQNIGYQNYTPEIQGHGKEEILLQENLEDCNGDSNNIMFPYEKNNNHALFEIENPINNFNIEEIIIDMEKVHVELNDYFPRTGEGEGSTQIKMGIAGNDLVELSTMPHSIPSRIPVEKNTKIVFEASCSDNAIDLYPTHEWKSNFESKDIMLWNMELDTPSLSNITYFEPLS